MFIEYTMQKLLCLKPLFVFSFKWAKNKNFYDVITALQTSFLTWKIYFPSCSGGPDLTPSLHHFPLDIWKSRGSSQMKLEGNEWSSENLNLTPTGELRGRCLSFIIPLKDTT